MKELLSRIPSHSSLIPHPSSLLNAPVTLSISSTSAMSETSPLFFLRSRSKRMAEAALSRFQTLRGAMRWPSWKPAASAAAGASKTFTSYLAARSFGCIPLLVLLTTDLLVLLRQRVAPVEEQLAYAPLV